MKMLKRWIAFGLVMILLAGVAFDHSSLIGNQVEAADLTEPEAAAAEADTAAAEASVLSETGGDAAQTESNTEAPAEEPQVTETPQAETEKKTLAEEVQETTQVEKIQAEAPKSETAAAAAPELKTLNFENDDVTVTVSEVKAGAIPEGASLQVVPILADNKETEEQYKEVEEQIQKDAAKTGDEVKGFLAYDISFVDPDGNEVEPNSEVKVTMEYKEPALPTLKSDTEIKDAEVSVLHLEEDQDGNIKEVVDMNKTNQVESMELGDSRQVKKVELTTDSFSIYTIEWKNSLLQINVVDSSGNPLNNNDKYELKYNWEDEKRTDVRTIAENIKEKQQLSLAFNKAVYVEEGGKFQFTATQIYGFIYKEENKEFWYCSNENIDGGNGWTDVGDGTVYFIFGDDPELKFDPIETVSTKDTIDINLFDYQVGEDGNEKADWDSNEGINEDHALKFVDTKGEDHNNININQEGSSGHINSGMVQSKLDKNGFPVLSENKNGSNGESLDYLFNDTTEENVKSKYTGLDHLFKIDNEGYHVFNSAENYAYLNNDGNGFSGDFTVGTIEGMNNVGFYPFSQPTYPTITNIKKSSEDAVLGSTGVNHYYGMTIETTFIQPKGGKITTPDDQSQDMVFKFSGDDDVWVFIDDVLVLDLGGIHGAVSGTINFATGNVTRTDINGGEASSTNIRAAFKNAGVSGDLKEGTNTFSDYTTHSIKFFYLERGNVDSNCMIKFNFPTIPKDSVAVAKEVTNEQGEGVDYAEDIDFEFNIKVKGEDYANQEYTLWKNGEEVLDENNQPVTGKTDENGNFTLKHTQMAVFSGLDANKKYKVTELGAYLDGYQVFIDDTACEITSEESGDGTVYKAATTGDRTVGDDASVVFKNAIENTATLKITKNLATGEESTDEPFQIQVQIQGKKYNGTYSVIDSSGNETSGYTAKEGIVSLEAGQTVKISGLPYGVSFEVEEMLNGEYQPAYVINGDVVDIIVPDFEKEDNTVMSASAQIIGEKAEVTVTNSKLEKQAGTTDVTVKKEWDTTIGSYEYPEYLTVTLYEDVNRDGEFDDSVDKKVENRSPLRLDESNGWSNEWTNLPGDTDFVVKEEYPEGYYLKTTDSVNDITKVNYIDRVETCKNLNWDLQKNNMLVTKKGNDWVIWTLYDLKLSDDEKNQVISWISPKLNGNMTYNNTEFAFGEGGFGQNSDINLVDKGDGNWQLQFGHSSTWSMFWYFNYERTQIITLTNEIIADHTISLNVKKIWTDNNPSNLTVEIQLLQNGVPYMKDNKEVAAEFPGQNGEWNCTFNDLPYFSLVDGKYIVNKYSVKETKIGGKEVVDNYANGYTSSVSGSMEAGYIITNTKVTPWQIIKVSSSDSQVTLEGAEFELSRNDNSGITYKGKSQADDPETKDVIEKGLIQWENANGTKIEETEIPIGTYTLKETKAPAGYSLSLNTWQVIIKADSAPDISPIVNGSPSEKLEVENVGSVDHPMYQIAIENTPLYSLPDSGGSGIYWYLFGGVLLMMAASLIAYKNKRREVLKS